MNTTKRSYKLAIMLVLLAGCCGRAAAQRKFLYNDTALHRFYAALQRADTAVVSILHLGDSHVQAGFFPGAVAAPLKAKFGDAGRGWVFPYNLAGTNGPGDYRWSSNAGWEAERNVEKHNTLMEGPGGILIRTRRTGAVLTYRSAAATPFLSADCFFDGPPPTAPGAAVMPQANGARLTMDSAATALELHWAAGVTFYGAVLHNGQPGVLYHAIGVNGARFAHYNKPGQAVTAQVKALGPQLVIISLGTNEAFGAISAPQLQEEMRRTVAAIRADAPDACLLFTTPPAGMMKKRQTRYRKKGSRKVYYRTAYTRNPQVAVVRNAIVDYCRENGFAWWDLYQLMPQDARFNRGWSPDRVHFNAEGYTLQGTLLYEALQAGYTHFNH